MKKLVLICLFLIIGLHALTAQTSQSLLAYSISKADQDKLDAIARAYGIQDPSKEAILDFFELEGVLSYDLEHRTIKEEEGSYSLEIESAQSIRTEGSRISLEGSVELVFTQGEKVFTLKSDSIDLDSQTKTIVAMGSVEFIRDQEEALKGELITFFWESEDVKVTDGSMLSRRSVSSEDTIELYTQGDLVSYSGSSSIVNFSNGYIATSSSEPYWSITSSSITVLDGSDLFIRGASLALGRVKLLWLPVFFYPSSRLVFNPAMGLDSTKGMFLNTTYEIYGAYEGLNQSKDASSLSMLLSSGSEDVKTRDGLVYGTSSEEPSLLQQWAEKTSSYMAVFADIYEKGGLFLGFDTKNSLFDSKLKVNGYGGIGIDLSRDKDKLRYTGLLDFNYNNSGTSLMVKIPWISQYNTNEDYLNRLGAFTLDSVLGSTQKFPSTYKAVESFDWTASGNISIPLPKSLKPFIGDIAISSIVSKLTFKRVLSHDNAYHYEPQASIMPSFNVDFSGTALDLSTGARQSPWDAKALDELKKDKEAIEALDSQEPSSFSVEELAIEAPSNNLLGSLSLKYSFKEAFSNSYEDSGFKKRALSSLSSLKLNLNASVDPKIFKLSQTLSPSYKYTTQTSVNEDFYVDSALNVQVPILGISYDLKQRLYSFKSVDSQETLNEALVWDAANVTSHNLSLSYSLYDFSLGLGWTFKPLLQALSPNLGYKKGGLDLKASWKFSQNTSAIRLTPSTFNTSLSFTLKSFNIASELNFDSSKPFFETMVLTQRSSFSLFDKKLKFSQSYKATKAFETEYIRFTLDLWLASFKLNVIEDTRGSLALDSLNTTITVKDKSISFWKNRINLIFALETNLNYSFMNIYATSFAITGSIELSIAEFLSLKFAARSSNSSFYNYYNGGSFHWKAMVEDLGRSFDFFGDGRSRTNFNLSSISLEAVHYMKDWDLHCTYSGSVVLSEGQWSFKSKVSVYCQWKAIAELKVENEEEYIH